MAVYRRIAPSWRAPATFVRCVPAELLPLGSDCDTDGDSDSDSDVGLPLAPSPRLPVYSPILTGSTPQISRAYSETVRSLEKRPMRATLRMAFRDHFSWSR